MSDALPYENTLEWLNPVGEQACVGQHCEAPLFNSSLLRQTASPCNSLQEGRIHARQMVSLGILEGAVLTLVAVESENPCT